MQRIIGPRARTVGFMVGAICVLTALTSCGDRVDDLRLTESPPGPDCSLDGMRVTPASASLRVGDTVRLTAQIPHCGTHDVAGAVAWRLSDTTVASVATIDTTTALVTARAPGASTAIAEAVANTALKGAAAITVSR